MTGAGSGERSLELAGNQKTISMNITLWENNKGIRAIARFYVRVPHQTDCLSASVFPFQANYNTNFATDKVDGFQTILKCATNFSQCVNMARRRRLIVGCDCLLQWPAI